MRSLNLLWILMCDNGFRIKSTIANILKEQLHRAHLMFKHHVDKHRWDPLETLWVREQCISQTAAIADSSLVNRPYLKLDFEYFCPFTILAKIGIMAYRLGLLEGGLVHHVFHEPKQQSRKCETMWQCSLHYLNFLIQRAPGELSLKKVLDSRSVKTE